MLGLKWAIPIGLIFSGVSAIGRLLIKGFNAISNYKKSKAMARAMKGLYKSQEIDHKCLKRLETSHVIINQSHQNCICTHRRQVGNVGCQDRERHVKPKNSSWQKPLNSSNTHGRLPYRTDWQ